MLTLNDGRAELWQWDTGRTLAVDADCSQVHFSNKVFGRSIDVDVIDGVAIIPDILLQTDKDLNVWAFVGAAENGYTKISKIFKVNRRNKPADYVFTPQEQIPLKDAIAIVETAKSAANDAIESAKQAKAAQQGAEAAKDAAELAKTSAETAANNASKSAADALLAKNEAESAQNAAAGSANAAQNSKNAAAQSAEAANTAKTAAEEAAGAAQQYAKNAAQSAAEAAESAKTLSGAIADVAQLKSDIVQKADKTALAKTDRSLDALWKLNQGITYEFQTDDAEAYQKTVPSGAKLANVNAIGGHTEVIDTELVSANVESVAERGRNLFDRNDYLVLGGYFDNGKIISNSLPDRAVVYLKCKGGATYTISRLALLTNERFSVACTKEQPKAGIDIYNRKSAANAQTVGDKMQLTITTPEDAMYLVCWAYWFSHVEALDSLQIEPGSEATPYVPYHLNTYPIPASVRALPGYGWSAGAVYNGIDRTETGWQYVQRVGSRDYQDGDTVTDGTITYYELGAPIITDITDLMKNALDSITVEAGGTLTFENAAKLPMSNSVEYAVKLSEVIG